MNWCEKKFEHGKDLTSYHKKHRIIILGNAMIYGSFLIVPLILSTISFLHSWIFILICLIRNNPVIVSHKRKNRSSI